MIDSCNEKLGGGGEENSPLLSHALTRRKEAPTSLITIPIAENPWTDFRL